MPTCLTCLESNGVVPLQTQHKPTGITYFEMLTYSIMIKLELDKGHPDTICNNCLFTVILIYEFRQKVISNFMKLKNGHCNKEVSVEQPKQTIAQNGDAIRQTNADLQPTNDTNATQAACSAQQFAEKASNESEMIVIDDSESEFYDEDVKAVTFEPSKKQKLEIGGESSSIVSANKNGELFACGRCPKTFKIQSNLTNHEIQKHGGLQLPCEKCNITFLNVSQLSDHRRAMHPGLQYQCDSCNKSFFSEKKCRMHIQFYHNDVDF